MSTAGLDQAGIISAELGQMVLPPALQALAWALFHFLWQGVLLAGGLALVNLALRNASARARYLAGCLTLLLMTLVPVLTTALFYADLTRSVPVNPAAVFSQMAASSPWPGQTTMRWMLGVWALGAILMSFRLAGTWSYLRYYIRKQTHPVEERWQQLVLHLARRMEITSLVSVRGICEETGPMLIGWFRPVILLPLSLLTSLPDEYLETLILHELAHIRRHDQLMNLLQSMVETLFFYHPCVWWVSRRIRFEREYCCDDLVLEHNADHMSYARALTAVAATSGSAVAAASCAKGGSLMFRIRRIVGLRISSRSEMISNMGVLLLAGLVTLGILGVALAQEAESGEMGIVWMPRSIQKLTPLFLQAAERHGVDPQLLAVMTLVESGGQPRARSKMGARGLLQIMPGTAEKIAAERGISGYQISQLEDPQTNIDFGAWYLAKQMQSFPSPDPQEAVSLAVAAYNGGPQHLRAHIESGEALRHETAHYRDLVLKLWGDRHSPTSQAFESFMTRHGKSVPDA